MSDPAGDEPIDDDAEYSRLMNYPDEVDYHAILGVSQRATDAEIRSAYRTLSLSFHPDKQPARLREAAEHQFELVQEAYGTLIDPQKRTVYDMLGAKGVREEWSAGGSMGRAAERRRRELGVRAMSPREFRRWFIGRMKSRERKALDALVRSRGVFTLGFDAKNMITVDQNEEVVYFDFSSVALSSYGVGFSFRTPFPTPKTLLGDSDQDMDQDESSQTEDGSEKQVSGESDDTELVISSSISGNVHHMTREVQKIQDIENPDAEGKETFTYGFLLLVSKSMNLGASVSHAVGDLETAKGIFRRRPFSLLHNSVISVSTTILPNRTLETSVTKAIQLIPGTKPFNVSLTTEFSESIFAIPPTIGLQVAKSLSDTQAAVCSWSSGMLRWPLAFQRLFGLGLKDGSLPLSVHSSAIQLAYFSLPKSQDAANDEDEEKEDDDEDGERQDQNKKSGTDTAESLKFQMEASPANVGLSFTYSRNIFFGGAVNDAALSEWSSEGHHPLLQRSEPRSVRLHIDTTVGLDLSFGWHVRGTRRVGEFTRMGFGVGLQGLRGLVMTVSWDRLGQRIQLPIAICPLEAVNADVATLAVIFPWATYCAVEFGLLRPRERKRRRKMIARRHRELKKRVPKKRAESLQAIEMMASNVQRRQEREEANGGLVITRAEYGYIPSQRRKSRNVDAENRLIDVTIPVAALVDRSQLVIPHKMAKFKLMGFYDPAPLLPKGLKVWYKYQGREHYAEANDSEGMTCPMRSHCI